MRSTPSLTQVLWLSRPCTTTGSARRSESRQWSASWRQAFTVYHWVAPSTQSDRLLS